MATFSDGKNEAWLVEFDAFIMDDINKSLGIDLCDMSSSAYELIETDEASMVKILHRVCVLASERDIPFRSFAKGVRGSKLEEGRAAILEAAADFFPREKWSRLQSNLKKRMKSRSDLQEFLQVIEMMPPGMQQGAMSAMAEMTGNIDLERLRGLSSAGNQAGEQSSAATDTQEPAESQPGD